MYCEASGGGEWACVCLCVFVGWGHFWLSFFCALASRYRMFSTTPKDSEPIRVEWATRRLECFMRW